jgi:hypothetical protein
MLSFPAMPSQSPGLLKPLSLVRLAAAISFLVLALLSCDQDLNSSQDQPDVDYVVIAADSATALPLADVLVRVTTITGDTGSYLTSGADGRVQLPTLASSRTLFEFSRQGYVTRDTIDTVSAKPDTVFHRPFPKLLRVRLRKVGETGEGRIQVNVLPRDGNLNKIPRATATYEDSTGGRRIAADTAGTGSIGLTGLKAGKTQVLVQHPGYLGRWFEATVAGVSDTGRAVPLIAGLMPLGPNSISGQVFYATGSGNKALVGARVEFRLKDSLAVPGTFYAYTSGDSLHPGSFEMDSVPVLDGQILYFKDRKSSEPVKTVSILASEVQSDGSLPPVILTIASDSSLPYLTKAPGDSVLPQDTLSFLFNQRVDALEGFTVELVNQGQLLADTGWNAGHTQMRMWLKGGRWTCGKTYQYKLIARNGAGQYFSVLGDTVRALTGRFSVPDSIGSDSVLLPTRIAFTLFNSGDDFRFGQADSSTSLFPDSTSQFGRLRWGWKGTSGRKADSLIVYYRDEDRVSNWLRWGAFPGSLDSATLAFSDKYATTREPKTGPDARPLPFKTGGRLWFQVIPKHQGRLYADTSLEALEQGMGPGVYVSYAKGSNPLKTQPGDSDSIIVEFRRADGQPASVMEWGADRPTPAVYVNGKVDANIAKWHWTDNLRGRVEYVIPTPFNNSLTIRVDLGGVSYRGKPIWQRNPNSAFTVQ